MSRDLVIFYKLQKESSSSLQSLAGFLNDIMEGSGDGAITRELKEKAVSFYSQHDVTGSLEKLLNTMFIDSPSDIYGYMVGS